MNKWYHEPILVGGAVFLAAIICITVAFIHHELTREPCKDGYVRMYRSDACVMGYYP